MSAYEKNFEKKLGKKSLDRGEKKKRRNFLDDDVGRWKSGKVLASYGDASRSWRAERRDRSPKKQLPPRAGPAIKAKIRLKREFIKM